jgi:hypothetical protein
VTDDEQPAAVQRAAGSPSWSLLIAVVVIGAVLLLTFTLFKNGGPDGVPGLKDGSMLPPFAAPLVLSPIDGDVNLARTADAGGAGSVPACSIKQPGVLTSCALTEDRSLLLAFSSLDDRCLDQLDVLNELARSERGRTRVVAVAVRGDRSRWRKMAAERWRYPVLYDRDGAMSAVYGVDICPQMTIARIGGRVARTVIGEVSAAELRNILRSALAGQS